MFFKVIQGKINLLTNILLKPLIQYDNIYLDAKFPEQPKYQLLRDSLEEFSRNVCYDVTECSNDEVIPLDELPNDNQTLVVFDDFLCEKQNILIDYFIRGRNMNCSAIYLSQSFFKTPKDIRCNYSHFCLCDAQDSRERSAKQNNLASNQGNMKAQRKNLILLSLLINRERYVQRTFSENFKMGLFNDV